WTTRVSRRTGSPPVTAAACSRIWLRSCAYSQMTPISAITRMTAARMASDSLVESDRMDLLGGLEPAIEEYERGDAVHQPAGDPHDEAGELLVGGRVEAYAGHAHRSVIGVPGRGGKAHQRAEGAADERGDEETSRRYAVARAAAARVEHRPPEEERTHEEAGVLGDVPARMLE